MNIGVKMAGGGNRREPHDFYASPPCVTRAVLPILQDYFPARIWEPSCGDGAMARALIDGGFDVVGTDLIDRGYGTQQDFLQTVSPLADAIVTNPPFKHAAEFIEHALLVLGVRNLALFVKATFWNSKNRYPLFMRDPPNLIAPLTWRPDFSGQGAPTMDSMWVIWCEAMTPITRYEPINPDWRKP